MERIFLLVGNSKYQRIPIPKRKWKPIDGRKFGYDVNVYPEFHPITSSRYFLLRRENDSKQSDEIQASQRTPVGPYRLWSRGKKLSGVGKGVPDIYVAFRFGAKPTILWVTNGIARVKIQIKLSFVRLTTKISERRLCFSGLGRAFVYTPGPSCSKLG